MREAEDAAVRRALCAAMRADASGAMRRQSDLLTNLLMDNGFDSWVGLEHLEVADVTALGATLGVAKSVVRVVAQVCGKVTRPVGDETDHQSQATAMSETFSQGMESVLHTTRQTGKGGKGGNHTTTARHMEVKEEASEAASEGIDKDDIRSDIETLKGTMRGMNEWELASMRARGAI